MEGNALNNTFIPKPNSTEMETIAPSHHQTGSGMGHEKEASQPLLRPSHLQDSVTDVFGTVKALQVARSLKSPSIPHFTQLPPGPIPFSLRLRHEALRRGYTLITAQETPFSLLFRSFKNCIFSHSREFIIQRVHYLLDQSTRFVHQTFGRSDRETIQSFSTVRPEEKTLQLLHLPGQFSLDTTNHHLASALGPDIKEVTVDGKEGYIGAEGVEEYLRDRGLDISAGSNFVTLPPCAVLQNTQAPTLFDEIRAGQELKLSVGKLMYGACLNPRPQKRRRLTFRFE